MKSKMLGLRTVGYIVPDLEKAKSWYTKAFGIGAYFDEPFYVGFNIGGFELGLMPEEAKMPQRTENIRAYWGVDNIQESYDHLLSIGATSFEKPMNVGGPLMVATVKDPWGNLIGMIYNPLFKIAE